MNDAENGEIREGNRLLRRLKRANFANAPTTLWVVHRRLRRGGQAEYQVCRINLGQGIEGKLRWILSNVVEKANQIEAYDYETSDQDERVLVRGMGDTDFQRILPTVLEGVDAPVIEEVKELSGAWATLIVSYPFHDDPVVGFRRAPEGWNLAKLDGFLNVFWRNHQLVAFDDRTILRLDQSVDFIGFQDKLFILSKKSFESGLNFRLGMESRRDRLIRSMRSLDMFDGVDLMVERAGSNMHYLRKFCMIEQSGYYRDQTFMERLKQANEVHGWGLQFVDGKLVITEETISTVITVLSNRRVQSMVNEEKFDVEGQVRPI